MLKADLLTQGNDYGNKGRVFFGYTNANNTYQLEFTGGASNTVALSKIVGGTQTVLGTAYAYDFSYAGLEIRVESGNKITVLRTSGDTTQTIFNQVQDTTFTSGKIGFGSSYQHLEADNVNVETTVGDITPPTAPTSLQAGTPNAANDVSLSWTAATDNAAVKGYYIYVNQAPVGFTTFRSYTLKNLNPSQSYTISVKAVDTSGNVSAASNSVQVQTHVIAINENFNSNASYDWTLQNASVNNYMLQLTNFNGDARAIYYNQTVGKNYTYKVALQSDAISNYAKTRIHFNDVDSNNTYYVQLGGGATNTVELVKVKNGTSTVLATYAGSYNIGAWDWPVITVQYNAGTMNIKATRNGVDTQLFTNIADLTIPEGQVGVSNLYGNAYFDNITVN